MLELSGPSSDDVENSSSSRLFALARFRPPPPARIGCLLAFDDAAVADVVSDDLRLYVLEPTMSRLAFSALAADARLGKYAETSILFSNALREGERTLFFFCVILADVDVSESLESSCVEDGDDFL